MKKIKWISADEAWHKISKTISLQEMRAFMVLFVGAICLFIPMIVDRFNCSDGNICGIIYRSSSDYDIEDIAGRYLLRYVAHLRSMFVFSWMAVILSILFLVMGSVVICRILRINSTIGKVVAGLFIVLAPCFINTFTFYFCSDSYIMGFLLNALAVYALQEKQTKLRAAFAICCMFLSLTFYQAYLFVAVVLFLFVLIRDLLEEEKEPRKIRRQLVWELISGLLAVAIYVIGNKIFKMVGLIYYKDSRFDFAGLFEDNRLPGLLVTAYKKFFAYFFNMDIINNEWKARYLFNGVFMALGILLIILLLLKKKRTWKSVLAVIVSVILLPWAFAGIAILDYQDSVRVMMLPACCLMYVGVIALWERLCKYRRQEKEAAVEVLPSKVIRYSEKARKLSSWVLYIATLYLLAVMFVYNCVFQLVMQYYVDKTDSYAQRIIERIEEEYPDTVAGSPVFVCGNVDEGNYPQDYWITQAGYILRGTDAGELFISNMQGYMAGWVKYMAYNFGVEYEMIGTDRAQEIYDSDFYKDMPTFPAEGSIAKTDDGIIVVKLIK